MSHQIVTWNWFVESELSDRQQQLLVGGVNSFQSDNDFAQGMAKRTNNSDSGPQGNTSKSNTQITDVNSGAKVFLASDAPEISLLNNM